MTDKPNLNRNSSNANRPSLSVVAPCFNEVGNLDQLLERVSRSCKAVVGEDYEIILVDDGSSDGTWGKITVAATEDKRVRGIMLSRNFGHQIALTAGLEASRGKRILIIDADLQDPPELLPEMMALADKGADVVYGQRRTRTGDSAFRRLASAGFYRLLRFLSDVDIPVDTGDFRLLSRRVLDNINSMQEHHRYIRGLVSWVGFKQVPLHYDRDPRVAGETGYSLKRLLIFSIDAIVGFSEKPLRLATVVGFTITALSALVIIYLFILWAWSSVAVDGWISMMASIFLLGGLNILFLGMLGEYIGRVFAQSKNRPHYIIAEQTSADAHPASTKPLISI